MIKAADILPGDTVLRTVRADPRTGAPAYARRITVRANEPGTVTHTPGTVRVRFLAGTDLETGQTVRWAQPPDQRVLGFHAPEPERVEHVVPEQPDALDVLQRMLAPAGS